MPLDQGKIRIDTDMSVYIAHLLGYVDTDMLKPLNIVVNACHGGADLVIHHLASLLPFEFIRIQHEPDGSFPNGIPHPLLRKNCATSAVREHGADFGIA